MKPLLVILMGSPADTEHCQEIAKASRALNVETELRVGSAHRTPEHVLGLIREYEANGRPKVYITVAGRSNALSGFTDPQVSAPVIACPPAGSEIDIWSSVRMPPGVACAYVAEPVNAAMFAAKILAPHDTAIAEAINTEQARQRTRVKQADAEIRGA
jgi:5-(carboxyamino)imidazole ribonucleotide mutase/phosphoribosylaminoimidazole-succinocarboxamide synthase